jgi:glutamate-1-semialdehyde 2,1-aminomutase
MLDRGVMLPPSPHEAWFVSAAHTDDDLDTTMFAARAALASLSEDR